MTLYIIYMAVTVGILAGTGIYLYRQKNRKKKAMSILSSRKNTKNHLYWLYRIYTVTPLIKTYFRKLKNRYRAILPADEVTLNKKATGRMTFCLSVCLALFIATCALSKGDLLFALAGLLACYIIFTTLINSSEEQLQIKLLSQLDTFISDVNSYFHDSGMIEDSIGDCLNDLPYEIGLHADKIHNIVNAVDVEEEVEKYVEVAPNKFLLLMAAICASVKEFGDKKLENGQSIFINNLAYLKAELANERLRMKKKVAAFSGKVIGVLVPLFVLKPLQIFMESKFPDTTVFYEGAGGVISLAIIIVVTFVCYEMMNALKDEQPEAGNSKFFNMISNIPGVKKILKLYTEHNYSKTLKIADDLKAVGDMNGTNVFYLKRIACSLLCAVLVVFVSIVGIGRAKAMLVTTWDTCYADALVPNETYRKQMQDFSLAFSGRIKDPKLERDDLMQEVLHTTQDETMASMIVDELMARNEQMKTYYFKWYMLLIALVGAVAGFFIPGMLLKYRKGIMALNREDEVAQFRTLILILMHEDGMTLDVILEWMERFANSFKASIRECQMNLNYSGQGALEKLRETEGGFAPFRRLVDSLMTVDKVGLEAAFDNLETEREYYQKERTLDGERLLAKRARKANKIQMVPVFTILILYLMIPFGTYVLNMLSQFNSAF